MCVEFSVCSFSCGRQNVAIVIEMKTNIGIGGVPCCEDRCDIVTSNLWTLSTFSLQIATANFVSSGAVGKPTN